MTEPVDLRTVSIFERHNVLFAKLMKLNTGESFTFINDHEPRPLYPELAKRGFQYQVKKEAEDKWVVTVKKGE
ncbi:MAG TPA: DUF2249 domain-containing protein [Candidatus Bathyarchaeia archaeon]|nr:DUF2249 domain-containing protein [Candidatus Bathyarchaeia archaeon]